jgi:hypothetical protein
VTLSELWRRGQAGWPAGFPVVQAPNPPLLVALAGRRVAGAADPDGLAHDVGRWAFVLGLGVWAWLEVADGANWLRRLLGAAGLAWAAALAVGRR